MVEFVCFKTKYYLTWYSSYGPSQPMYGEDYLSVVCNDCVCWGDKWEQEEHIVAHITEMGVIRDIHEVYCCQCNKPLFQIARSCQCEICMEYINSTEKPQYQVLEINKPKPDQSPFDQFWEGALKDIEARNAEDNLENN